MPRTIDDRALDAVRALWPAEQVRLLRSARLFLTDDGHGRADRLHGTIAGAALPALDSDQVADQPGSGSATVLDRLNAVEGTSAPIADPVFTGTVTAPHVVATADLTTVDLIASGNSTIGNADADATIVWGHLRHRSAAPSIAIGAALGSGGTPGVAATIVGSDQAMQVTLVSGASALTAATAATITFATARPNTNFALTFAAINAAARTNAVQAGLSGHNTATITIVFNVAPLANTTYQWDITVKEFAN